MTTIYQTRSFHEPFITTSIDVRFEIRLEKGRVVYLLNDEPVPRDDFIAVHAACDTHEDRLKVIEDRLDKMADYVEHIATYLNPEDPRSFAARLLETASEIEKRLEEVGINMGAR